MILCTAGIVAVPYASAPTACAPPMAKTRSTPDTAAAASTSGLRMVVLVMPFTVCAGIGATMTISPTPATLAGTALISTLDG